MDNLCYLFLVFVMLSHLFIAALWSPAGKGLTSWLLFAMFYCIFVTFPCGILGQAWYWIVSIPDLCRLSYFYCMTLFHSQTGRHMINTHYHNSNLIWRTVSRRVDEVIPSDHPRRVASRVIQWYGLIHET